MKRGSITGPITTGLLVLAAPSPCGARSRSGIAGTYDFWLCKAARCGRGPTSEALVRGKLILSDTTLELTVPVVNGVLRRLGESSGAGVAEVRWATDSVVGIRVGPPEVETCRDVSLQHWREVVGRGRR